MARRVRPYSFRNPECAAAGSGALINRGQVVAGFRTSSCSYSPPNPRMRRGCAFSHSSLETFFFSWRNT